MRSNKLAHILDPVSGLSGWWLVAAAVMGGVLIVEHHIVAGFSRQTLARRCRVAVGITLVAALSAAVLPGLDAQSSGPALPDLISDPPRPSYFNELNTEDGQTRLVVTFDGYVHNVGQGALDVVGNPQEPDGMKQRVRNDDEWQVVGAPTVRFETDDGHNHFHLIEAIEYVLWNDRRESQTAIGSKIGFCLVDSEQMEDGFEQSYSEEGDKFCQEDSPDATSLRMGITPGWRDIYDATTTLQWVDVSNVTPGRYWIGAITDPNNEIVESNEDNNGLVFSDRTISVPGFAPLPQRTVQVSAGVADITLSSMSHGTVTEPIYVIERGPTSGMLDVPVGASLMSPDFRYFPEPGFEGVDQFVFSVRDGASPYPFDAPTQLIEIEVSPGEAADGNGSAGAAGRDPVLVAPSTFFESDYGVATEVEFEVSTAAGGPARLYALGLPTGLVADTETGIISGIATQEGIFDVELRVVGDRPDSTTTQNVSWIVNPPSSDGGLSTVAHQSTPRGELTRLRVGTSVLGQRFEATGLPPGLVMDPASPVVLGTASAMGVYEVTIRQLDGDDVVAESPFLWTIRSNIEIAFAL